MPIEELRPVYSWSEARAAGLTRAQVRADGRRVSRGAYVSRAVPLDIANACLALAPHLPAAAAFSHLTAAALYGAPVAHTWPVVVAVPPGVHRPRRARLRTHVRTLDDADVRTHRGLRLTAGAQTFLDLALLLPPERLVAVGDALYRAGHLDAGTLARRLERADGVRGVVRARDIAPLLTPHAASLPESVLRYWILRSTLPDPEVQVPVLDRRGRQVARADLGYARWKVALEYEGRQHADGDQFDQDIDRYSLMAADGWLVLRFARRHLRRRETVLTRVAGALHSRGARW